METLLNHPLQVENPILGNKIIVTIISLTVLCLVLFMIASMQAVSYEPQLMIP